MSTPVEQIKQRLSVVDVVGSYIKLTKAGSSYKALCPFHHEKSPSFNVSPARDAYYCFGCNRGGDIFTFVEEIEGIGFPDALKLLAERAGVVLERSARENRGERERLHALMEDSTAHYVALLASQPEVRKYLSGRGLTDETVRTFRIGYAPLEWRTMYEYLRAKGYNDAEIEKAGMAKRTEKGFYDRFRGRVMFPIRDAQGHTVAFSGRVFGEQKGPDGTDVAKYINSPEGPLYDKSAIMFGYDMAKQEIRKRNFAIIVEGQMDLIMAHQAGSANTVAVSGTALTGKHLGLIKRLTDNVVFAFDADDAGIAATHRAFGLALGAGLGVRVAAMPEGKDPADAILKNPDLWMKAIAESKHIIDFTLDAIAKREKDPRAYRAAVEGQVLPLVLAIPSKIEAAHFISEIARRIGVREEAVWEEVTRQAAALPPPKVEEGEGGGTASLLRTTDYGLRTDVKSYVRLTEETVWGILFWQERMDPPVIDIALVKTRYHELADTHGREPFVATPDEERDLAMRAEYSYEHTPELARTVDEMLDTLESEVLKMKQEELWRKLADAEREGDKAKIEEYTKAYQEITPRRIELENRRAKQK